MESSGVTQIAVVGGGIAGCWAALKLAERGVITTLITYSGMDRGGAQGATGRSVGAINTSPLSKADFKQMLEELGHGQTHPSAVAALGEALGEELEAIRAFAAFKSIKLGIALDAVSATELLERIKSALRGLGVRIIDAWVVKIAVDGHGFQGLQLSENGKVVLLYARSLIIASGGYAGLFRGSLKIPTYGTLLGRYLEVGGAATNLEFVFKHGYGKADRGALTPTEELPGSEVYDDQGVHVKWLERELFSGRGTHNHLEAFRYWRRNSTRKFYIDFTHQPLYKAVIGLNEALAAQTDCERQMQELIELCIPGTEEHVKELLNTWIKGAGRIGFERFDELKPFHQISEKRQYFRVSQIAYFSMGGIAHKEFATNIPGVYVTGEAMHDFGANRVGGLPWGLYLVAGRRIAEQCVKDISANPVRPMREFDQTHGQDYFDTDLLLEIQLRLSEQVEEVFESEKSDACIAWFRSKRSELRRRGQQLNDGYSWLLVAEAIVQSSRIRHESRGCFFRKDQPRESTDFDNHFTLSTYDRDTDKVSATLLSKQDVFDKITNAKGLGFHASRQKQLG